MGYEVVLTADRTLMSDYNRNMFIGFAATFPAVIPEWLYLRIFCPPVEKEDGRTKFAPLGTRKIEAVLSRDFSVGVVHPDCLEESIDGSTKVVGITTGDPLGLGPASSTFSSLLGREPYTSIFFQKVISSPLIKKLKVVVGGPGAWQLDDERLLTKYDIDCLLIGEGEKVVKEVFSSAVYGEELPRRVHGEVVPVEEIPSIIRPTINGLVEISRGCGRGCKFCSPTMLKLRHREISDILREVEVNFKAGMGALLHAEDVLRYGTKGPIPDEGKVISLFQEVRKITSDVGISHFSLSSALAKPSLVERICELLEIGEKKEWFSAQTGIETGSPRLASIHLKGKAKPFPPQEWGEVVRNSFSLLNENRWAPCATLIMGLPGEKADDVVRTIELLDELREYKSFIIPLFFVPIGTLDREKFFRVKDMLPEHWQLLASCIKHSFRWLPSFMHDYLQKVGNLKAVALRLAAAYMKFRLQPYLETMESGENPLS